MKIFYRIVCFTLLSLIGISWGQPVNNFTPKKYWFGISTETPPALIWIVDSRGRRAGADPNLAVDKNGIQGKGFHGLEEIPSADTDQQNIQNDTTGQLSPETLWSVSIPDGPAEIYTVNLKGLKTGLSYVGIHTGSENLTVPDVNTYVGVFVQSNIQRQLIVSFNPKGLSFTIQRVVANGDLLSDVKNACDLKQITTDHVCDHLEKKASAIQDALEDHHEDKAKELVKSFLHSMGKGVGDDKDDYDAIQEPALTILREDAKALLAQIAQQDNRGDNDHHDK